MNSEIINNEYFKTAKEATMIFTVKDFKGTGDFYLFEGDAEFKIHITNFCHAEFINIGGNLYLYVFPVLDSGSDYYPKLTVHINDNEIINKQLDCKTEYGLYYYNRDISYIKERWNVEKYKELEALNGDTRSAWFEYVGKDKALHYEQVKVVKVRECKGIDITDITGNGLLINGYLLFDYLTTADPNEITFDSVFDEEQYEANSYLKSETGSITNFFELPKNRIDNDIDGLYSWPYYNTCASQGLGIRPDMVNTNGHWIDGDGRGFMIVNIVNGMLDYINATKNYHKFKGIQWDVWLDGEGSSMSITIVPTIFGQLPKNVYPRIDIGYADTETESIHFEPVSVEFHSKTHESTFGKLLNMIDNPLESVYLGIRYYYLDYNKNERHGIITGIIPYILPDSVDKMPSLRGKDGIVSTPAEPDDMKSTVIYHFGLYDGDKYDDNDDITDDIEDSNGYNGVGLLTTQYALTSKRAQQLGWKLWGASFVELIEKVNNNPIENVISLKVFPFDISGTESEIVLGNVKMGVNGALIKNENYNYKREIGSVRVKPKYNSFLDYAPFTKVSIWLPFIGLKDLDTSFVMGKTISVRYIVDIITGACKAELRYNGACFADFEGSMGIDVSLTASNRAQVEAAFISNTVQSVARNAMGIVGGAKMMGDINTDYAMQGAGGVAGGIVNIGCDLLNSAMNQYHTTSSGAPSPACSAYQTRDVFLIYDRPTFQELKAFNATRGRMCMLSRTIGTLSGYTQVTPMIDLSDIPCSDYERKDLISILSSGFFV